MKVSMGELEVLYSGSVLQHGDNPIKIVLDPDDPPLLFTVMFGYDYANPNPSVKLELTDETSLNVFLINYDYPLGVANSLTNLGTAKGRELSCMFSVTSVGSEPNSKVRTFNYSFFLGKTVASD